MTGADGRRARPVLRAVGFSLAALIIAGLAVWGALALWYRGPFGEVGKAALLGAWIGFGLVALTHAWRRPAQGLAAMALGFAGLLIWWGSITPRGDLTWAPELAVQFTGAQDPADPDRVTLTGVRNFDWRSPDEFTQRWETREYDLGALTGADMMLTYWEGQAIAHAMVSFGFEDGRHLAFSGEVRREAKQEYSEIGGLFKEFELILLAGDERDIVRLRSNVEGEDVRLYRVAMSRELMRELFLAYVATANSLAARPAWYNTITANCTTIVFEMVRRIAPGLPLDWRLILSGYLPEYLYGIGALDMRRSLPDLEAMARIADRARAADRDADFSAAIRAGVPPLPQ